MFHVLQLYDIDVFVTLEASFYPYVIIQCRLCNATAVPSRGLSISLASVSQTVDIYNKPESLCIEMRHYENVSCRCYICECEIIINFCCVGIGLLFSTGECCGIACL